MVVEYLTPHYTEHDGSSRAHRSNGVDSLVILNLSFPREMQRERVTRSRDRSPINSAFDQSAAASKAAIFVGHLYVNTGRADALISAQSCRPGRSLD